MSVKEKIREKTIIFSDLEETNKRNSLTGEGDIPKDNQPKSLNRKYRKILCSLSLNALLHSCSYLPVR